MKNWAFNIFAIQSVWNSFEIFLYRMVDEIWLADLFQLGYGKVKIYIGK